jgi:hypothetical protein
MPKIFIRKPGNQERMKEILVSWLPYSMGCGSAALCLGVEFPLDRFG